MWFSAKYIELWLKRTAFVVWAACLVVIGGYLLAGHLLTLPIPSPTDPKLVDGLKSLQVKFGHQAHENWTMVHVLYGSCGCSRRVIRHLARRGPTSLGAEYIMLVAPSDTDLMHLKNAGFSYIHIIEPQDLYTMYAIEAAPLFAILNPSSEVRYIGGYTNRKRGPEIEDITTLQAVRSGANVEALPLFGCATNARLAQDVDPLGLR